MSGTGKIGARRDPNCFVEAEGLVHFVNAASSEFTLCGDAWDLGSDADGYEWVATERRTVTCPLCAAIIESCRGIRTRTEDQ